MMLSPLKSIRRKCLDCCLGSAREVNLCVIPDCSLYPHRFGKNGAGNLKAIRRKCLDCSAFSEKEVRECFLPDCVLYLYRMGHNPKRKGIGRKGGSPDIKDLKTKTNSRTDFEAKVTTPLSQVK